LCLIALGSVIIWENATAAQVTFINDSANAVVLTDCSTDLVTLAAGTTQALPIASDHPKQCSVEYLTQSGNPSSFACLLMPPRLGSQTVVKISSARPTSRSSSCSTG
jgi:hypothetical protein